MKAFSFLVALTALLGCGRVGIEDEKLGDGAVGRSEGGPSSGAGGSTSMVADARPQCTATALSTAPLPCAVGDWAHAQLAYPKTCKASRGGYQARCPSNDAIGYTSGSTETWCFYGTGTGQLVGSLTRDGKGDDCKSFDLHFTLPDTSTCGPVSGGDCVPDAGP
ncbi:MAG TPA: hypothetical protein VF395_17355 [Polyangiaceae bacterium]